MIRFRLQAPARAMLLLAATAVLACNGTPTATDPGAGTTTKVSKKTSPKPGASASAGAGGTSSAAPGSSVAPSTAASTGASTAPTSSTNPNGTPSTAASTAVSTAPTTSTAPSTATSTAPSTGTGGGDGGTSSPTPLAQAATPAPAAIQVGTYAGEGTAGFQDGAVGVATFNDPRGLAVHATTGDVYVADTMNHAIRKIAGGQVTTLIGTGEATSPQDTKTLNTPQGVAVMADGTVLIADTANNRIRKLRPTEAAKALELRELDFVVGGLTAGFQDGIADASRMASPTGIALTADQTHLWVVDTGNNVIRLVDLANDSIETVAGSNTETGTADGSGLTARFSNPKGCAAVGNDTLYVVDSFNAKLRKVVKTGNAVTVTTVGSSVFDFNTPSGVIAAGTDPETNGSLMVADTGLLSLQRFAAGAVEAYVASNEPGFVDGPIASAKFKDLEALVLHPNGAILVADSGNHRIRKLASP